MNEAGRQPVGSISSHHCNQRCGTFSYGVDIAKGHRRRGYTRETIALFLCCFIHESRYQKVTVPVHADNPGSVALHEKLAPRLQAIGDEFLTGRKQVAKNLP